MNWYDTFNRIEPVLWWLIAIYLAATLLPKSRQQQFALRLTIVGFLLFGVTDMLEVGRDGRLPIWLCGAKILCGLALFAARLIWVGWNNFRWNCREVWFGAGCLLAVLAMVLLQQGLDSVGRRP